MSQSAQAEPFQGPDDREGFLVHTPYSEAFIDDLKEQVPSSDRRWWTESRGWWVSEEYWPVMAQLLLRYFDGYGLVDEATGEIEYVDRDGARAHQGGLGL